MTIKPLSDRVVLKPTEAEEKTKTGIILTAAAQEKPQIAEVVAVGPGEYGEDGKLRPMNIKVGDKVTLTNWVDYNGTPLMKTRDYYYVMQLNGDRAVLTADSMNGTVYAAVNKANLRKV